MCGERSEPFYDHLYDGRPPDATSVPGKTAVFSRYQEGNPLHGHSVRTEEYSYTEYSDHEGRIVARMLYDVQKDPAENINLAEGEAYKAVVKELSNMLKMIEDQS